MDVVGRFAPSPSGRMHLGNVYCAVMSWLAARSAGGGWLLRIEDLDQQRCRREYALQLIDDLQWLGLEYDGEPLWQSQRTEIYAHYFDLLCQRKIVYPCYCSRADLHAASAPHAADGTPIYAGTCRPAMLSDADARTTIDNHAPRPATHRPAAYRIYAPDIDITFDDLICGHTTRNLAHDIGDFVVRRADGTYAYQLAVVVDDALSGVTQVIRGADLLTSTAQQIYLYRTLGMDVPEFGHIHLLCSADGRRLSKRDSDLDMQHLRASYTPEQLLGIIAHKAGLQNDDAPTTLSQLLTLKNRLLGRNFSKDVSCVGIGSEKSVNFAP